MPEDPPAMKVCCDMEGAFRLWKMDLKPMDLLRPWWNAGGMPGFKTGKQFRLYPGIDTAMIGHAGRSDFPT